VLANNLNLLSSKAGGGIAQTPLTSTDIRQINQLAKRPKIFELLSQSLAPSIYGHDWIKKAILLLLLGGAEKRGAQAARIARSKVDRTRKVTIMYGRCGSRPRHSQGRLDYPV
jgi:DNA replication licensing factor MCM3